MVFTGGQNFSNETSWSSMKRMLIHEFKSLLSLVRFLAPPVAEMPETPTHLSLLSDSVMRTPALNELPDDHNQGSVSKSAYKPSGLSGRSLFRFP